MDWCTPISLFNDLNKEFHFKLDAAADDHNHKCELYYTQQQNGLTSSWNCGGTVFCNPPYGSEIKNWVKKAYTEYMENGVKSVLLLPARTDTSYFHDYIYGKAAIRFLRGRLKFTDSLGNERGNAPFPSMIVIFN